MNWQEKHWRKKNPNQAKIKDAVQKEISEICRLYRNGYFPGEIAQELLLPYQIVIEVIKRFRLHRRYNKQDIRNRLKEMSYVLTCSDLIVISIKFEREKVEEIANFGAINYGKNGIVISKGKEKRKIKWKDVIEVRSI